MNLAITHCENPVEVCLFSTCEGFCGGPSPGGCMCDESCCDFMDCCHDKKHFCGGCWPFSSDPGPVIPPQLSCQNNCGGAAIGGCWCDESCCSFDDCCGDKTDLCHGCKFGSSPSYFGSCVGHCGGQTVAECWCDNDCFSFLDCCWAICSHCPYLGGCNPNPADLTGNNMVSGFDLLKLLGDWGPCQFERCLVMEPCEGDFNHDGVIDGFDLLFLLGNWGSVPLACGNGSCCSSNFSPGCDDPQCCDIICKHFPSCCTANTWTASCAQRANMLCPACGGTPPR